MNENVNGLSTDYSQIVDKTQGFSRSVKKTVVSVDNPVVKSFCGF